ncbi:MAG: mevalonate kinase [Chloroflexi bacterium]|nr:MAG: mevalonate kinase [Chloroflexota bacterium]
MPAFTATAPGKIILFGEHAVVYGEPAIAVPVQALQARAVINAVLSGKSGEIQIEAPDISLAADLKDLDIDHPLRAAVTEVAGENKLDLVPACRIRITSTIPLSSGLGSSAAISSALIRALSAFLGVQMTDEEVSQAAFEVETIHHGTPSGIDNNVVTFRRPVYYQKGNPMEFLSIQTPFHILIAGSGFPGNTRKAVSTVRESWLTEPERYQKIFSEIGNITRRARELISAGDPRELGPLMDQNHSLLQDLGVSTTRLDHLVQTARNAGALGAKLSGGGLGGHLIALVDDEVEAVRENLLEEGADSVFLTTVESSPPLSQAE